MVSYSLPSKKWAAFFTHFAERTPWCPSMLPTSWYHFLLLHHFVPLALLNLLHLYPISSSKIILQLSYSCLLFLASPITKFAYICEYLYSVCTWSHPVTNLVLLAFFPYSLFLLALFISVHLSHLSASLLAQRVRCEASQLASLPVSLLSQSNGSELHLHPVQSAPSL